MEHIYNSLVKITNWIDTVSQIPVHIQEYE